MLGGNTIFINPALIGNNLISNEALLFHEALHELGMIDSAIQSALGIAVDDKNTKNERHVQATEGLHDWQGKEVKSSAWWVISTSISVILASAQTFAQEGSLASVKVIVCDTFGKPIAGATVSLTSVGPNHTFTAVAGESKFGSVPYGRYDLAVRLAGFEPWKQRVRVYQSSLVFYAGLELGATHSSEPAELSGSIRPSVEGRSDLWVRLVAIYGSDLAENVVNRSGKFELDGMASGKYLLLLFEEDKVLSIKPVDVLRGKQLVDMTIAPR